MKQPKAELLVAILAFFIAGLLLLATVLMLTGTVHVRIGLRSAISNQQSAIVAR
jgi:hypothetical protein